MRNSFYLDHLLMIIPVSLKIYILMSFFPIFLIKFFQIDNKFKIINVKRERRIKRSTENVIFIKFSDAAGE